VLATKLGKVGEWKMQLGFFCFLSFCLSYPPSLVLVYHYFTVIITYMDRMFDCLGDDSIGSLLELF